MSAPRSVLVPFEELLSEACGYPIEPGVSVMFTRHNPKSACWWLTWGDTLGSEGILFGPAYDLAIIDPGCMEALATYAIEGVTTRTAKSEMIAACLRRVTTSTVIAFDPNVQTRATNSA